MQMKNWNKKHTQLKNPSERVIFFVFSFLLMGGKMFFLRSLPISEDMIDTHLSELITGTADNPILVYKFDLMITVRILNVNFPLPTGQSTPVDSGSLKINSCRIG